jgi:hypothetical protein
VDPILKICRRFVTDRDLSLFFTPLALFYDLENLGTRPGTVLFTYFATMLLPSYLESLNVSGLDFDDHHSLTKDIITLNVVFMSFVLVVTGIRMSIRLFLIHAAGLDDCLSPSFLRPSHIHSFPVNGPIQSQCSH